MPKYLASNTKAHLQTSCMYVYFFNSMLDCGFCASLNSFTSLLLLLLDCPRNIPFFSITSSSDVIVPSNLPFARISIAFASTLPVILPLTITFCAKTSPIIIPVLPTMTVFLEWITPSNSPSVWKWQSVCISPLNFVLTAIIVAAPPVVSFPLDCLLSEAKNAMIFSFLFQK